MRKLTALKTISSTVFTGVMLLNLTISPVFAVETNLLCTLSGTKHVNEELSDVFPVERVDVLVKSEGERLSIRIGETGSPYFGYLKSWETGTENLSTENKYHLLWHWKSGDWYIHTYASINRLTGNFSYKESTKADTLLETYTNGTCELVERKIF